MSDYPHVPAAFINAIAEEGTKAEAVKFLQEQWNETCALRAEIERLRAEREAADKNAIEAWAQRDAYMESNVKLLAEIERLRADNAHWQRIASQGFADEHAVRVENERLKVEIERLRALLKETET